MLEERILRVEKRLEEAYVLGAERLALRLEARLRMLDSRLEAKREAADLRVVQRETSDKNQSVATEHTDVAVEHAETAHHAETRTSRHKRRALSKTSRVYSDFKFYTRRAISASYRLRLIRDDLTGTA